MIDEHELSHSPFRPWCAACVRGRAKDAPSRKVQGRCAEHVLPRVRMDYRYLTEDVGQQEGDHGEAETTNAGASVTVAVLQESLTKKSVPNNCGCKYGKKLQQGASANGCMWQRVSKAALQAGMQEQC